MSLVSAVGQVHPACRAGVVLALLSHTCISPLSVSGLEVSATPLPADWHFVALPPTTTERRGLHPACSSVRNASRSCYVPSMRNKRPTNRLEMKNAKFRCLGLDHVPSIDHRFPCTSSSQAGARAHNNQRPHTLPQSSEFQLLLTLARNAALFNDGGSRFCRNRRGNRPMSSLCLFW